MIGINENTELSYSGDDTTATYDVTFPRFDASELKLYIEDETGTGDVTELVQGTHYTVANILPSTGTATVTLLTGFAWISGSNFLDNNWKLWVTYNSAAFQDAKFSGNGRQALSLVQKVLDRFAMVMRSINVFSERSIRLPRRDKDAGVSPELPTIVGNAGKTLIVNSGEDGWEYGASSDDIATSVANAAASATNAQTSADASAASATASANSATASANSATTSANEATNSANSATASANSATASATSATDSANSATASAASATASANSATASANSATESENSYQKSVFTYVEKVDHTDSPVSITSADDDKVFIADSSLGEVVFNFDALSSFSSTFHVGVMKDDRSANKITINPNGAEKINGVAAAIEIDVGGYAMNFNPDAGDATNWEGRYYTNTSANNTVDDLIDQIRMYQRAQGVLEAQVVSQESRINQLWSSTFLAVKSGSQDLDNGATNELLTASTAVGGQGEFCRVDPNEAISAKVTIEAYRKTLTEDRFATYDLSLHYVDGTWYLQEDQVLVLNNGELPEITFGVFTDTLNRAVVMYSTTTLANYDPVSRIKWQVNQLPNLYTDQPELADIETPLEIGNLEAWYDFSSSDNLIDVNKFYVLYDRSFNQRHVSQRDVSKQADVAGLFLNSRNVAQFSGAQFYLLGEAISRIMRGREYSLFILARHTDDNTDGATEGLLTVTERTDPSNDIVGGVYFLNNQVHNVTEDTDQASGAVSIGSFTNIIVASDGTSTDFYIDGVSVASGTIALDAKVTNNPTIGAFAGLSNFLNGYIAEIQIYSKKLSGSEITDLRNYINSKWGE